MDKITIVTDSTADLPREAAKEFGIEVVPLSVQFPTGTFRDGVDLRADRFYPMLKESEVLPTTSQPPAGEFVKVFKQAVERGASVIAILISSKLSGTYQAAVLAKSALEGADIEILDSANVTGGLGLQVLAAAEAARSGRAREEVLQLIKGLRKRVETLITLDTLEYLHKGGRIGAVAAFIGALVNLKPMLKVQDGVLVPVARMRSHTQALNRYIELMSEKIGKSGRVRAIVMHGHALEYAMRLKEEIVKNFTCVEEPPIVETGAVLGTHTGPGAYGVAFYGV
ncbi:MAG: DegV family protein [Syntrophothermus sp.]